MYVFVLHVTGHVCVRTSCHWPCMCSYFMSLAMYAFVLHVKFFQAMRRWLRTLLTSAGENAMARWWPRPRTWPQMAGHVRVE
jgi:hypothetical protein